MNDLALRGWHQEMGARFTGVNGAQAVDHYGDPAAEHQALGQGAGILDLSFRGRICLTGADRQRFLNGQVTNNVKDLAPGQSCYAAMVNHRGRMEGDLYIHALAGELLLDFEPGLTDKFCERLEKFIIADDVQIAKVEPHYGLISLQGPRAPEILTNCGLGLSAPREPNSSGTATDDKLGEVCVVNLTRTGTNGFDLFVPTHALETIVAALTVAAPKFGGRLVGWQALEIARIEAGIPRFGVDMDETNLAPETGIESRAISYTKGCYTGQEVIARIRTYGQVAKALRGLVLPPNLEGLPAKGQRLLREGKEVGYVTSAVYSPTLNTHIALAYVRRECNQPGTELALQSATDKSIPVRIVNLPFQA